MLDIGFDRGDIALLYKYSSPLVRFNTTDLSIQKSPTSLVYAKVLNTSVPYVIVRK